MVKNHLYNWNNLHIFPENYEKHAPRVSQVIAAVTKVSCKHGLWFVARVNKKGHSQLCEQPLKNVQCKLSIKSMIAYTFSPNDVASRL